MNREDDEEMMPAKEPNQVLVYGTAKPLGQAIVKRLTAAGRRAELVDARTTGALTSCDASATNGGPMDPPASIPTPGIRAFVAIVDHAPAGSVLGTAPDVLEETLRRNVAEAIRVVRAVARHMCGSSSGGSIVLVLNGLFDGDGATLSLAGAASAGALERAVQTLACELGPHGIRVNAVRAQTKTPHEPLPAIPLGRIPAADDVAAVAAFLAGDEASYVSGAVVPVDGGAGAIR